MAKWGSFEFGDIERLANAFNKAVDERVIERWIRELLYEVALRALARTKRNTPTDTGELRRSWQIGNVVRKGNAYEIELYNNTYYASFVEYGHRTGKDLTKWVEGRFMMTISMKAIEKQLPKYIEKKQMELLDNLMNGRPVAPRSTGYSNWAADVKKADEKRARKQKREEAKRKKEDGGE